MSLFGSLSVGTSGLRVSQYGLNVVAHNLSNVETPADCLGHGGRK